MILNENLKLKIKGGGSFVDTPPKFTQDGERIFLSWQNKIFEYNVKTGKRTNIFKGTTNKIIGFDVIYKDGAHHLIACSSEGEFVIWKVENSFVVKKKNFTLKNIQAFQVISYNFLQKELIVKALISFNIKSKRGLYSIDSSTEVLQKLVSFEKRKNYYFDLSIEGRFLTVAQGNLITFINLDGRKEMKKSLIGQDRYFTAVACHPQEECVISGDTTGRILLWRSLFMKQPIQTVYHWHTLPIQALSFSACGNQFFSGGNESVLVKWNMENIHLKKFLPRLPSNIKHINLSSNNLYIALSLGNNSVQIIDSRFQIVNVIQNLVISDKFNAGIHYNSHSKSLVLNGNIGHVQFYSPEDMHLLYNLDISGHNKLTKERNAEITNLDVSKIALNKNGIWMATVEELFENDYFESRLKFWNFDVIKQFWKLVTSVEFPHDDKISDITFQQVNNEKDLKCITCSLDKKFKIWQLMREATIYKETSIWKCIAVGYYQEKIPKTITFSSDSSLLAVAFESVLTTWTPDTCKLKCELIHPIHIDTIEKMVFGVGNNCHLILTATLKNINVWNLLTFSVMWTVPINYHMLITDPLTEQLALLTSDKKLYTFSINSSEPSFSKDLFKDIGNVVSGICIPNTYRNDNFGDWHRQSQFYLIDSNRELYSIDSEENYFDPLKFEIEDIDKNLFSKLAPQIRSNNLERSIAPVRHAYMKKQGAIDSLLQAPLHTMIPARKACSSILNSMLLNKL